MWEELKTQLYHGCVSDATAIKCHHFGFSLPRSCVSGFRLESEHGSRHCLLPQSDSIPTPTSQYTVKRVDGPAFLDAWRWKLEIRI